MQLLCVLNGADVGVQNQLLKGCQNKVAKVAASCLFCLKEAIRCHNSPQEREREITADLTRT
jgi:hypothetical protein